MPPKKKSSKKRSNRKILDAFQIAERAQNPDANSEDGSDYGSDDDLQVHDGILDARRFVKDAPEDFEDEELDSDEALGSDDDYDVLNSKFSQSIRDKAKKKKLGKLDLSENEESEDEGYASIDESKLVTLSEAWDMDDRDLQKTQASKPNEVVLDDDAWESESEEESSSEESESEEEESDEEDIFANDEEEEEDDVNLTSTVSRLKSTIKIPKEKRRLIVESREENEYNLPTAGGATLSLADMISAVDGGDQDAILIDSESKSLETPLPKRIQVRHDRAAAYELAKDEVDKWKDTVQSNRQAEVLKFPMNKPEIHDTATTFRSDVVPTTDLEVKVQEVLKQSALIDDSKEATFEEIAVAKLSPEEMKKRTAELRLMRELMFRDEKRAKRIKKIKSKQYHKIKKKERLRNQELVESDDEDTEDHDLNRARERMTLKHKTQSSWAKSMIKSGLTKDANNRAELEEMLRQGEKLRAKQMGFEDGEQSNDEVSDIEREYDQDDEDDSVRSKLGKGVMGMDFMKKAEERAKQENLQQLAMLKKDDLELFDEDDGSVNVTKNQGRRVYVPTTNQEEILEINRTVHEQVEQDQAKSLTNKLSSKFTKKIASNEAVASTDEPEEDSSNPWLSTTTTQTEKSTKVTTIEKESSKLAKAAAKLAKQKQKKHNNRTQEALIDMNDTLAVSSGIHDSGDEEEQDEDVPKMFTQKDLIKQAFAGDDVVSEFEAEKKRVIEDEDDYEEDLSMPGWGDWAGGSNKKSKKRKIVRKVDGVVQKDKRKDKNLKNVIINERVNKKNLKYQSSEVPYPFESREQYERSLRMPVGQQWTSRETHQKLTMPRVIVKQGTVIDPLKAPFK
ncbi:uncharacterized protein SPAPADRAFT_134765 [Spathaspora passalidarum NRRL Y-27907]|uniref:U3 small nucleolar RNA-associated protein 14 n=1 Tax=Spathaspora passalidarum (strain NRRL Y-27907 / 11-Y1) TaxID=619300 RepID=G3AJ48_SPAPN|nr:uncharacterized protein SPAPADRAFT_134765 [Spathaspora passalidarum NRRL Y-27907]EGW33805.1 hypothetical protein SPAPADRAFT_134765 [Spathaspora passalidarum NRRL Y-27907]